MMCVEKREERRGVEERDGDGDEERERERGWREVKREKWSETRSEDRCETRDLARKLIRRRMTADAVAFSRSRGHVIGWVGFGSAGAGPRRVAWC